MRFRTSKRRRMNGEDDEIRKRRRKIKLGQRK
jgi:hypothetical protein